MIELVMHTVKNDMVIHTEKTGIMRLVVEIEYDGKIADVFDKATCSFDGLQPEQVDRKVKCYNCKKEGHFAKDCKKAKVKDYEYYKTKMLLAKKDKDEQVFLAEDQAWMKSSTDSDQEINANMVFMAQIEKVLSDSEAGSSSADEKISEMRGSEYGEQDRKAAILYEYETFKADEREQLLDTYLRYLQVINDLKKCGYKKDNCELNYKFLNNLQPEWKQYGTLMRQTKNLMDINIDALYNILKQNQGDVNDALGYKKKAVVVTLDPLALLVEKTIELKKITSLLAKAFNRRKFYSKPTNNNLKTSSTSQSANKKQEFDKKEDKKADEKKSD
nr:hypothetical protein [Tanacetum cinerariifolium]